MTDDDLQTIHRVLDGDVDAFRILVERYQGMLFSLVGNLVEDRHECDDIAQEVFLAAYRNLAAYDVRRGKFSTWLLTIARNKCVNELKRRRPASMGDLPPGQDGRGPSDGLMRAEAASQLEQALMGLPIEQKTAFVMAEIQSLSLEEISRIEGAPLGTIKSRISRAKEKLRAVLLNAIGEDV